MICCLYCVAGSGAPSDGLALSAPELDLLSALLLVVGNCLPAWGVRLGDEVACWGASKKGGRSATDGDCWGLLPLLLLLRGTTLLLGGLTGDAGAGWGGGEEGPFAA